MVYGLDYTQSLLDSLPSVSNHNDASKLPSAPGSNAEAAKANLVDSDKPESSKHKDDGVRLLSAPLFSSFHLNHLVSHPPDHVLYPFLHGLEGENDAQNTFFANANAVVNAQADSDVGAVNSHHVVNVTVPNVQVHTQTPQLEGGAINANSLTAPSTTQTTTTHQLLRPKVPQYRGLVWVVCEDDLKDDRVALSIVRRKPLPTPSTNAGLNDDDDMLLDDSDDDAMLTSSDEDDSEDEDTTSSDSEASCFDVQDDLPDDHALDGSATRMVVNASISEHLDEDQGILSSVPDDVSPLGKPMSKETLDSMPYMHPVVMPHQHQHGSQFASLPAIDTSNIPMSTSGSSSSGSEVESVFTSTTMSPQTTAATSVSGSPLSASCSNVYEPLQVIELQEATASSLVAAADDQESSRVEGHHLSSSIKPTGRPPKVKQKTRAKTSSRTDPAAPPLLTCTFRPKELLRKRKITMTSKDANAAPEVPPEVKKKSVWEFVPARVPDGISLRNFGIQVPIYATLSDIVIYSPKGATPNAIALAQRFREAVKRKREERTSALKGIVYSQVHAHTQTYKNTRSASGSTGKVQHHHITAESIAIHDGHAAASALAAATHPEEGYEEEDIETRLLDAAERFLLNKVDEEMLDYNVFVLDADEEKMRKTIGHLMMHSCGSGVPGVEGPQQTPAGSSSTKEQKTEALPSEMDGQAADQVERGEDIKMNGRSSEAESEMELVLGDIEIEVDARIDSDGDVNMAERSSSPSRRQEVDSAITDEEPLRNTVDFALREREEMRDLTKATEILSLFPTSGSTNSTPTKATFTKGGLYDSPSGTPSDPSPPGQPPHLQHLSSILSPRSSSFSQSSLSSPTVEFTYNHPDPAVDASSPSTFYDPRVGQVFLGNSGDVPLLAEQPVTSIENARARLEDPNADETAPDDPFNYAATNGPSKGLGYDICIECHELAPFPTPAHLRAAEEHLVTLERVWRDRTIRKEIQNIKAGLEPGPEGNENMKPRVETKKLNIPPRPPPHANAIIHIPFPSSPPNSQSTLAQLLPVMRFLEKWVKPVGDVHVDVEIEIVPRHAPSSEEPPHESPNDTGSSSHVRRWSNSVVASILPSVFGGGSNAISGVPPSPPLSSSRSRSNTTPSSGFGPFNHGTQSSQNPYSPSYSASYQPPRHQPPVPQRFAPTRPLKILIYSADGYTESSLPSLCLLMSVKGLSLPEAYLELQVAKRRSFFVYQHDLGILKRVESRLREDREREREKQREAERQRELRELQISAQRERERAERERVEREREMAGNGNGKRSLGSSFFRGLGMGGSSSSTTAPSTSPDAAPGERRMKVGRPAAKSVSFAQAPIPATSTLAKPTLPPIPGVETAPPPQGRAEEYAKLGHASTMPNALSPNAGNGQASSSSTAFPSQGVSSLRHSATISAGQGKSQTVGRPRANTSPWLPSAHGGDHQSWFNDPRFDGSFPSRVLPFLYLGNLNHASNVYMLHALGITHVVSVGECALLPPPFHMIGHGSNGHAAGANCPPRAYKQAHPNTAGHGSLWIEEREGRIKVLDIKGVCDDGIDTLEPQLEPICDWIDKARAEGGQVLVHCRVGVSRSATVTIAYVMKHLSLPLVDAYLIVRSRRLSVLIQPNMRLLYNLCGWEIKLAKERAGLPSNYGKELAPLGSSEVNQTKLEEKNLRKELARTLTWPYLSKEVHALNEKYLH